MLYQGETPTRLAPAMPTLTPAALVINTASRNGRRSLEEVQVLLREAGLAITTYPITNPANLSTQVKKLVEGGVKLLLIGGGDGTISEIVDLIAYTEVTLGILPLGTANSFSRSLNIPPTLPEAVAIIAAGKTAQVDLGKINQDYFANAVSIGFASSIAHDIPDVLKHYLGTAAYAVQCLRNIRKLRPFQATFETSQEKRTLETFQIVIANGAFYGPASLVAKKRLQSASLSIFTFKNSRPFHILRIWLRSLTGKKFSEQDTQLLEVRGEVTLTTVPPQEVSIDGEIKTKTPIRISIAPAALTVLVAEDSKLHP